MIGVVSYKIVEQGFEVLCNLDYCGVIGVDLVVGDGVGIFVQVFDVFLWRIIGIWLFEFGFYVVGLVFMFVDEVQCVCVRVVIEFIVVDEGIKVLGWCEVFVYIYIFFEILLGIMFYFEYLLICVCDGCVGMDLEYLVFVLWWCVQYEVGVYFVLFFLCMFVYKGMLMIY